MDICSLSVQRRKIRTFIKCYNLDSRISKRNKWGEMVKRKPDAAEAIFSTINILCVPSKKGEDHPLKFSLYIHPKIVKEYADGLSPKIYEKG